MISRLPEIAKAVEQIRAGELSPVALVDHCLAQIERFDARVQAWVHVDADAARSEARTKADSIKRGENAGLLYGIPIGIKDIVDVAGWPTRAGSPLRGDHVAQHDAPLVQRLRDAGAIILGKTVTTELAYFDPPPTRNPWNLECTPGGSSSGSAAAVAMEMCMGAVGSQTGGSIIRPASYCGVFGLKPTFGAVSLEGVVPVSGRLDHAGPIARCAGDLLNLLFAMAEPRWLTGAIETGKMYRTRHGTGVSDSGDFQPPRLMLMTGSWFSRVADSVASVTNAAIEQIRDKAVWLDPVRVPEHLDNVHEHHLRIMSVEAAETHRAAYAEHRQAFGPQISGLIAQGLSTRAVDYCGSLYHQAWLRAEIDEFLARHGAIAVTPATTTTAPGPSTTGDPSFSSPWSFLGLPTATVPCGLADGLPCGLQLIAPRNHDLPLLDAAAWCAHFVPLDKRPPLLSEPGNSTVED